MNINTSDNGSDLIISHSMLCTSCAFPNTADFTRLKPHVRNIKMHKEHLEQGRCHTQEEMILQNKENLCPEPSLKLHVEPVACAPVHLACQLELALQMFDV